MRTSNKHKQPEPVYGYQIFWRGQDGSSGVFHSWDGAKAREFAHAQTEHGHTVKMARRVLHTQPH